jgi:hypothetical protein
VEVQVNSSGLNVSQQPQQFHQRPAETADRPRGHDIELAPGGWLPLGRRGPALSNLAITSCCRSSTRSVSASVRRPDHRYGLTTGAFVFASPGRRPGGEEFVVLLDSIMLMRCQLSRVMHLP